MLFRTLWLLIITSYLQVQCYIPVSSVHKKVDIALRRYSSNIDSNPIVHSLLNVLVHDKRAKAFVTNEAIEKSLEDVKKFNKKDESVLRRLIYETRILSPTQKLSTVLEENIESALDTFFAYPNLDDNQTFDLMSQKGKVHKFK
ncbi:hypothetical protein I4U23_024763 [Adineta vaga]|nr:hypothetical protein I4U23_024763 [Adineta vaga]